MREFKFRAWDKANKRMMYNEDTESTNDFPALLAVGLHGKPISIDKDSFKKFEIVGWNRDHNLVITQYTGLKDKNGKEIYEGDIIANDIKGKEYFREFYIIDFSVYRACYQLTVLKPANYTGSPIYISNIFTQGEADSMTIVGNIYENPELLESVK